MSRCGWTNTAPAPGGAPALIGDLTNVSDAIVVDDIPADQQLGMLIRDGRSRITDPTAYRLTSKIDLGSY